MNYLEWIAVVIQQPFQSGRSGVALAVSTAATTWLLFSCWMRPYYEHLGEYDLPRIVQMLPILFLGFAVFFALSPVFYGIYVATLPPPPETPPVDDAERQRRLQDLLRRLG